MAVWATCQAERNSLSYFMPFVNEILGGEEMTKMDFNGCLFSLPGAKEQLWHIDGEHLFTSEAAFCLSGNEAELPQAI